MQNGQSTPSLPADIGVPQDVYRIIGLLTRQLHDSLNELGYADQLRGTVDKLPDAKSRLSYISRLTGEAAEKVLTRVELAKSVHDSLAAEARAITETVRRDPVKAVREPEIAPDSVAGAPPTGKPAATTASPGSRPRVSRPAAPAWRTSGGPAAPTATTPTWASARRCCSPPPGPW